MSDKTLFTDFELVTRPLKLKEADYKCQLCNAEAGVEDENKFVNILSVVPANMRDNVDDCELTDLIVKCQNCMTTR